MFATRSNNFPKSPLCALHTGHVHEAHQQRRTFVIAGRAHPPKPDPHVFPESNLE
jgi:hypothetical protein